jgi:predicted dehydrogenase
MLHNWRNFCFSIIMTKILLVGAGNIAQSVHLPVISALPGAKLVGIVDRQLSKARILAEKYSVPAVYKSISEALASTECDAVMVTTSTDAHVEVALAAIEAQKHVFIERPIGRTLAEATSIHNAAQHHGVQVMVGMNHRFRPDVANIKNAVDRGEIGEVFYIKAGWVKQRSTDARWLANADKSGGGVLVDLGVPVLDMVLYISNFGKVRSVVASTYNQATKSVEDGVVAMIQFASGAVATLEASWSIIRAEDLYYCNVFGKRGSTFINPYRLVKRSGANIESVSQPSAPPSPALYRKSYEVQLKHFVNATRGLVPMLSTASEAIERMKIVEAIYASAELQREIVIP